MSATTGTRAYLDRSRSGSLGRTQTAPPLTLGLDILTGPKGHSLGHGCDCDSSRGTCSAGTQNENFHSTRAGRRMSHIALNNPETSLECGRSSGLSAPWGAIMGIALVTLMSDCGFGEKNDCNKFIVERNSEAGSVIGI